MKSTTSYKWTWVILVAFMIALSFWMGWAEKNKIHRNSDVVITPTSF